MSAKVLTANRLSDGIAVWLAASGSWVEDIDDALVARHDEAVQGLEASGRIAIADNRVVDVNLIDVEEVGIHIRPLRLRERIRAYGPSISYLPQAATAKAAA